MGAGRPGEGPRQASGSPLGWGRGCTPTGIPRQAAAASLPPSSSVPPPRPGPRGPGWKSGHFRSPEGWAEGRRVLWPQVAAALLTAVLGTNKLKLTRQCPSGSHPAVAVPWPLRLALSPPPTRGSVLSPSSASKEPFFCIRLKNGDPPPTFLRWGPGTGFIAAPGTILKSTCQQSWGQGPWRDFLVTGQGPLRKEGVSSHPPAPRLLAGLTCQDRCDRRLCGQRLFCQRRGHHRQWRRQTHTLRFPNLAGDMVGKGEKHPNLYE